MSIEKLYTLVGQYPDQDFNFVLTGDDIGLISATHSHFAHNVSLDVSYPGENAGALNSLLADNAHSHTNYLYSINGEFGAVTLAGTTNADGTFVVTNSSNTITVDYTSNATGGTSTGYINQNNSANIISTRGMEVQLDNNNIITNYNEAIVFDDEE